MDIKRRLPVAVQIAVILLVSVACASVSAFLLPHRIPWRGEWDNYVINKARTSGVAIVDLAEAKTIADAQSRVILDARPAADYEAGHLPGAFTLPQTDIDTFFGPLMPLLAFDAPVMTYCSSKDCDEALLLTEQLRERGVTSVVLFVEGFKAWKDAGYPVEGGGK
jgi:rhodanese-related sulfurtransferase